MAGGKGLEYASSTIAMLTKKKDKQGTDVVGNIIRVEPKKSRFNKADKIVEVKISYASGLSKYHGLIPLGEKYGIYKKNGNRFELPDGSKEFEENHLRQSGEVHCAIHGQT